MQTVVGVVSIGVFWLFFKPFSYNGDYMVCVKRASKMIVPPKEMLLSFSIGTFLTNYDVTIRTSRMF